MSTIFHSYGEVTSTGERLQILTYAWYSWQLRSEGSLDIHNFCNMEYPFIMIIHQDPWHSHLLPIVCQLSCYNFFQRLKTTPTGDRSPIFHMRGKNSTTESPPRLVRWNLNIAWFVNLRNPLSTTTLFKCMMLKMKIHITWLRTQNLYICIVT